MSARKEMLGRVREALMDRPRHPHPGDFAGARPEGVVDPDPMRAFAAAFAAAGGEVVRLGSVEEARDWLREFSATFASVSVGATVPASLRPDREATSAEAAALGVSLARCAVAETGSLVLDARDGRRTQLLPPTHVVLVRVTDVHATLLGALRALKADLPSAYGLHSGPSKSADIGQILVRGVHGPGRIVAALVGGPPGVGGPAA